MTTYIGGQVWPAAKTILDEAFAEFADEPAVGWVPTPPELEHHCPDGICAGIAAAFNLDEQAADWRSLAAWARTVKTELHRARAVRGKRVKMLRRQYAGQP